MIAGKRSLITGGAGLVGSHIADLLVCERPAEIRILDNFARGRRENLSSASANGPVSVVEGDIRDRALVRRSMDDVDVVFHQVAIPAAQCAEEPRLALEVLAEGTFNVLEAAVRAGVQKVVAASSASVYGPADEFPTTERHHPYNNGTLFGAAKAFEEGLLRSFNRSYDLPCVALRHFDVYGPRMAICGTDTAVLIRWMEQIANGQTPVIFGDGTQTLDLVHANDVARANILAAKTNVSEHTFNVASGTETTLNACAELLARIMGAPPVLEHRPERRVDPVPRRLASTRLAKELLGFEPFVSLEQGLKSLVEWWKQQPIGIKAA
jgi:UDP-glucose 4-epimerase